MIDEKDITDDVMEQWKEINEEQAYKGSALEERLKLTRQIFTLEQENTELEAQIEKMKNCGNCKNYAEPYGLCCYSLGDEDYDCCGRKWEIKEK